MAATASVRVVSATARARNRDDQVDLAIRRGNSPVRGTGADSLGLRPGEDVVHGKWGEGVVIDVSKEGAEAVVRFRSVGEKRLSLSLAPLKRA